MIFNIIITIIIIIIIILKSFFKLKSLLILLEPKIVSHFRYFRGTILVDLDVPLSFPVFILSSFCDNLICNDLNCTLSHKCKLSMTQAPRFVCEYLALFI